MPRIYLCFLWHMHQPFYKDLFSGEYRLPWTRMHALKDYYGMVQILEEFPAVRQTFNLVPSMMVQVDEYAKGKAVDPFLNVALKPAELLTQAEQEFLLRHSFHADPRRMIYRYPRYGELYDAWQAVQRNPDRARRLFGSAAFRDLQVLSQLAWFDEIFLSGDSEVRELVTKGRDFTVEDQALMGRKQKEILALVMPAYQKFAARGQIEISTTPFYHPILPLICDSDIAAVSHPGVPLPSRFQYPQDARVQLKMARQYLLSELGTSPAGLWPSEGSVSDEVFSIAAESGFKWAATDNAVLERSLGRGIAVDEIYRPYLWEQGGRRMHVIFRDHFLSDLIGFVYSRLDAVSAAHDFLHRIRENCREMLASGRDALVPIILDGENAWEYYDRNGRPFLRALYQGISNDSQMSAITVSEALSRIKPQRLDRIFPGSWINANFDVWIGAEEDNKAWEYLLRARQTFSEVSMAISEQKRQLAFEELLIAEGSDWCWWYGPEHHSANRVEFDELYRDHLANVYRALDLTPPEELSRPILKIADTETHLHPTGSIRPNIDGEVTSYFEWIGAGTYSIDGRSGSMHGKRFIVRQLHYGSDGTNLFLRIDFQDGSKEQLPGMTARLSVQAGSDGPKSNSIVIGFEPAGARVTDSKLLCSSKPGAVECAFHHILEARIPLDAICAEAGQSIRLQFSLWQGGLPVDAVPQQGWLELNTATPTDWTA
jgi:alpha-amylase/alpha-mannosidase (GH57 family)